MRNERRWRLFWWTLPAVLVFLVAGGFLLVLTFWNMQAAGRHEAQEYTAAELAFERQRDLTQYFPEPWKAVFNQGTSQLFDERYPDAVGTLEDALEIVPEAPVGEDGTKDPESPECLVRTNLSLSHEGTGDQHLADQQYASAIEAYRAAMDAIGPCTSDGESAAEEEERPEPEPDHQPDEDEQRQWDKSQQAQEEQEQQSGGGGSPPPPPSPSPSPPGGGGGSPSPTPVDPRIEELQGRNQSAAPTPGSDGEGYGGGQNW
ncbi:MAG: hypothetical protein Q4G64_04810 [bacterium]|nr:hypothetical protein [bacterium]